MQTENTAFINKKDLDKACFQRDMAYCESKDLAGRTQSDKVFRDKAFEIASDPKYHEYQRGLASMVYKFYDKTSSGSGVAALASKSAVYSVPNYNLQMNFISRSLENSREEKVILNLKTIFGMLI